MSRTIKVVTLSELDTDTSCDCGPPQRAPVSKPARLRFGKLAGFGKHCVVDAEGAIVRCFRNPKTAKKIARGFGSGFRVKTG